MKKTGRAANKLAKQRMGCWKKAVARGEEEGAGEDVRRKVRAEILAALPGLVKVLLEHAQTGSSVHIKLLMQLERDLAEPEKAEKREKNLEEILMEQWRKDAENAELD